MRALRNFRASVLPNAGENPKALIRYLVHMDVPFAL